MGSNSLTHTQPPKQPQMAEPWPFKAEEHDAAGRPLSLSREALSGDAGYLPKSLPWSHSPIYLPRISNKIYILGSFK